MNVLSDWQLMERWNQRQNRRIKVKMNFFRSRCPTHTGKQYSLINKKPLHGGKSHLLCWLKLQVTLNPRICSKISKWSSSSGENSQNSVSIKNLIGFSRISTRKSHKEKRKEDMQIQLEKRLLAPLTAYELPFCLRACELTSFLSTYVWVLITGL